MTHSSDSTASGPDVVVIGMALRFPEADSPEEFWKNLANGVCGISAYSDEKLLADGVNPSYLKAKNYVKAGGLPRNHKYFSPEFFGFSGREAELIDPQQRIALECVHEALERAGCDPYRYPGKIGVYAGASFSDYRDYVLRKIGEVDVTERFLARLGNDNDFLSTRISYKLNLKGPSLTVQSACSTSLVAVHLARKALQGTECEIAIAGGVSLECLNTEGYFHMEGGMLSPDGLCRAFDADANGTVFTSGAGFVVLKRLDDALRDRDRIYAVIKGSAINNDGNSKVGYFAPSVEGQIDVIDAALKDAGVTADSISYIEAHGTATPLGDPIEVEALTSSYRKQTKRKQYCALGSVKTNIGHLNTAAGISGFIKTCLSLAHRKIPPTLNFRKANPNIDFGSSPFYVNASLIDWVEQTSPRRAGVTALGVGGTNAHVILEEAPDEHISTQTKHRAYVIPLSAKDPESLSKLRLNLADFLEANPDSKIENVAFTLQFGRTQYDHRAAIVSDGDVHKLIKNLRAGDESGFDSADGVVFILPGFGHPKMAAVREFYEADENFRSDIDSCVARFNTDLKQGFSAAFMSPTESPFALDVAFMEPALFCLQYALISLLRRCGVKPAAIMGYGVGEYVAAVFTGAFDLDTAIDLVAMRANCLRNGPRGQLMEVSRHLVANELVSHLVRTYENDHCLGFTGDQDAIWNATATLTARGVPVRLLGEVAMPAAEQFLNLQSAILKRLGDGRLPVPSIPVVSGWSGRWWAEAGIDAQYWCEHAVSPPNLSVAQRQVNLQFPSASILQFGPRSWTGDIFLRSKSALPVRTLMETNSSPHSASVCVDFLEMVAQAWVGGMPVNWTEIPYSRDGSRIVLPTYPLKKRLVWFDGEPEIASTSKKTFSSESSGSKKRQSIAGEPLSPIVRKPVDQATVRSPMSFVRGDSGQSASSGKRTFDIENPSGKVGMTTVQRLANICAQVLKEKVGDHGSSFLELGGDSIRATQFIWLVEKELKIRLDVEDVLYKSIAELATSLKVESASTKVEPRLMARNSLSSIVDICKRSLKIEIVEPTQTFLDCGGDSIRAAQFIWLVEKELKVRLDVEDVLYKSFAELAAMIEEPLQDAIIVSAQTAS